MIKLNAFEKNALKPNMEGQFKKTKRKDGLVEKTYNGLKNVTNFGVGSKKVEKKIDEFVNGKISEQEAQSYVTRFRKSQENAEQTFGDVASGVAGLGTYFLLKNQVKNLQVREQLNALPRWFEEFSDSPMIEKLIQNKKNILQNKKLLFAVAAGSAALVGGFAKSLTLKLNRIGSKEYKISTKDGKTKKEIKKEKKALRKARRKQNLKNFATGMFNGLLAPITALAGGIAGIPLYLAATMGLRYVKNSENKNKSLKDFAQNYVDNGAVNAVGLAALGAVAVKKVRYNKTLFQNYEKVVAKLKEVKLQHPDLPSQVTAFDELEGLILNSPAIKDLKFIHRHSLDEHINALTKENIFAVKFIQIKGGGDDLSRALKESCPPTRTIEEAQEAINKLLNNKEYSVSKLLGVGTVAESYLAKGKDGKEVCIKILKEGISAEKILADKEKFANLITNGATPETLSQSQKYLLNNLDNLADGILKEVDLKNEMDAANKLRNFTKKAKVVSPIEAKPGVYIMEKADGISLDALVKYWNAENDKIYYQKKLKSKPNDSYYQNELRHVEEYIKQIKAKSPDFEDFNLSDSEIKKMLTQFMEVQVEQFSKVNKDGKTLHADIHPGNIFVDVKAVKENKGKFFTLIDTGNTIDLSKQQTLNSMKLTDFINKGNVKDLSSYVLDGAILPKGMTKEEAVMNFEKELKTIFFDSKTNIQTMNNDTFLGLSNNIMRKYGIIANDTQLNLNKAKKSAFNSFEDLIDGFFGKKFENVDQENKLEAAAAIASATKDAAILGTKYVKEQKMQELKNLFKMPFKEMIRSFKNPNNLKTNSEDYLTYKIKQAMPSPQKEGMFGGMFD